MQNIFRLQFSQQLYIVIALEIKSSSMMVESDELRHSPQGLILLL